MMKMAICLLAGVVLPFVSMAAESNEATLAAVRAAITAAVPKEWAMTQATNDIVRPTHMAKAQGIEIRIERNGYTAADWKHGRGGEVHIWLMSKDYAPGTPPEGAQVAPAHEAGAWRTYRVFVWGSGGTDWPRWETDVLSALKKAEK